FPRSLAITSTRPNEGKSSSALSLAVVLGRTGKSTLLIDGDLRSPSVHHMLALQNAKGLSNFLAGDDAWQQMLQQTGFKNLSIMATGPMPPSAAELLSGDRLNLLIQKALEEFDNVIIDAPPVLGMTDAPLISKATEGVVYV
ncbi:CpsD/CapB family tyrosine-protein kinase, partial [Nocardia gipuzkoensis]|uniref:CpsD/CapB family tyrosine-protein kinase n=1 Tax=Nocardia gipuzkoensis TaxID=2749991 RepID=UPI0015EEB587